MGDDDSSGILSSIVNFLGNIIEGITNLPSLIIDGIKAIFIPDVETIKAQFNTTLENIERSIGLNIDGFTSIFDGLTEAPVTDVKSEYNIPGLGTFNVTFLDSSFLTQGVDFFRPLIRGLTVFMLLLYHYKQLLSFIGQDPNIQATARENWVQHMEKTTGVYRKDWKD